MLRYHLRFFSATALTLTLQACTVGPDYVAPDAKAPAGWTKQAAPAPTATTATADAWWAGFNDPILTSLIVRAAQSNLDLRQAALRIAEARTQVAIVGAGQWPSVGGNAGYARQGFSESTAQGSMLASLPTYPNPFDQFQVGFDAGWEIDLFGRVRRQVEAASADQQATIENGRFVLVSLTAEVARAYIDLRAAQRQRAVLDENLRTQRDVLALARDRMEAGLGTDLDVENAAAQVANTDAQIPGVDTRISRDINDLGFLLALEPGALRTELEGARAIPPVPPQIGVGLPADLLRRRPDIRAAEAQLHAATARVGVAEADLFPRVTLNASFGTQAENFPDLGNWASRFFSIGPSLRLPIFEGGRLRATVQMQDLREKEAAIAYARTVLAAFHEVENAMTAYGQERQRLAALQTTVARNRAALDLARQRYKSGVTSFLNVLDAERNVQQGDLALAQSTAAVSLNLVALYKALGGGWTIETSALAEAELKRASH